MANKQPSTSLLDIAAYLISVHRFKQKKSVEFFPLQDMLFATINKQTNAQEEAWTLGQVWSLSVPLTVEGDALVAPTFSASVDSR